MTAARFLWWPAIRPRLVQYASTANESNDRAPGPFAPARSGSPASIYSQYRWSHASQIDKGAILFILKMMMSSPPSQLLL